MCLGLSLRPLLILGKHTIVLFKCRLLAKCALSRIYPVPLRVHHQPLLHTHYSHSLMHSNQPSQWNASKMNHESQDLQMYSKTYQDRPHLVIGHQRQDLGLNIQSTMSYTDVSVLLQHSEQRSYCNNSLSRTCWDHTPYSLEWPWPC